MSFTLNGAPIQSATVRVPRFGVWSATVIVAGPLELADSAKATLVVGDLTLVGVAHPGGTFAEQAAFTVIGGAGRWGATVAHRSHRSDGGVTVAEVAADLATDAGELGVVLEAGAERPLGYAWARRSGLASDALEQLVGQAWWVAADGVTHLGARPVRPLAPTTLRGLDYEPALRRATVALEDDAVAQFLPGAVVSHSSLPVALEVGQATIRVEAGSVSADLLGERPASELLGGLLGAVAARGRTMAPQLYQVDEDIAGRASCRPAGPSAAALPELAWIDRAYGVPGVTAQLQPGALVLVSLLDGSPGSPRIVGYLPGAPASVALAAADAVTVDAPSIELGGASPLALATNVAVALNALRTAVNGLGGTVAPFASIAATKTKGA